MSIALARRYRPRRFEDLLVQDHVAAALRGAVAKNRVGHGYLLTGPRGVGKTTAARILAMALNCERRDREHPTGEPCGECGACLRIWNGSTNLDVVEIDAASNRGVDDARNLRESAMYAASEPGHHKVYIIDEAHMLTREAWNALLKILEEPPPGVVFVFATTEPQKIANAAAPVMSRLQRFDFRRIGPAAIHARLRAVLNAEQLEAEDDALLLIARHADGGMRDALSVLDQCISFGEGPLTAERVRDVLGLVNDAAYASILALVADRRPAEVFAVMDTVSDAGADLVEFAGGLADLLRALVMHHYGTAPEGLPSSTRAVLASAAERLSAEDAVRMLKLLTDSEPSLRRSANPRLVLETLLLRWAMMDRMLDLRALLRGEAPAAWVPSAAPPSPPIPTAPVAAARKTAAASARTAPTPEAPAAPLSEESDAPAMAVPQTPEALLAVWPDVLATAGRQSRLLAQALDHAAPELLGEGQVGLRFGPDSAVFQEGVERQLPALSTIVSARMGSPFVVSIERVFAASGSAPARGKRLSAEDLRADRLRELRTKDPALDAAADSLDLELVDEG
ncbi:MAG: DNA polymerase III subunit gamma/tau [Gemmatimonadota bacterium]